MHPYNRSQAVIKVNCIRSVYSKSRDQWERATPADLEKICNRHPEKLRTFDENGWLPLQYVLSRHSLLQSNGCILTLQILQLCCLSQ